MVFIACLARRMATGLGGDLGGQRPGGAHQLVGRHALLHGAEAVEIRPRQALAREHQAPRLRVPEQPHGVAPAPEQPDVVLHLAPDALVGHDTISSRVMPRGEAAGRFAARMSVRAGV
jgi:hypothetical protein